MFEKILKIIAITIFMAVLILPTVLWFPFSFSKKYDFDLGEKRNKATMSEAFNIKTYTKELEKYYDDRIPFRSYIINKKNDVDTIVESPYKIFERTALSFISGIKRFGAKSHVEEIDGVIKKYMDDAVDIYYGHGLTKKEIDPYDPYVKYPAKYSDNYKVIIGQSDWLYLNDRNISLYKGESKNDYTKKLSEYVKGCELLNESLKKLNKKLVILICPEKEEIYPEYMPYMEIENEKERALYMRDYMATASQVSYIYPKEELLKAKEKYLVYRKYDSHWNDIGAYIATKKLYGEINITIPKLRDVAVKKVGIKDCELIPYGNLSLASFSPSFEYDVYYKMNAFPLVTDLPGSNPKASYKSNVESDFNKKLMIIGDSFSHSMLQFLYRDFNTFYFFSWKEISEKIINDNMLKDGMKDSDIIVIEAVERNEPDIILYLSYRLNNLVNQIK